jgi:hypothetical protein
MRHTNAHLPFVTKTEAPWILNKLRYPEKQSVSFLPSTKRGVRLDDAGVSYFTRSEIITLGHVSNMCLLFEFLT